MFEYYQTAQPAENTAALGYDVLTHEYETMMYFDHHLKQTTGF